MFDPTAFDNIKVVVEGDLYDLDLEGHLSVTKRIDLIDLASMSRTFEVEVRISDKLQAIITIHSDIKNIAIELLPTHFNDKPGCIIKVGFQQKAEQIGENIAIWEKKLHSIWGEDWKLTHQLIKTIGNPESDKLITSISFDRLIYEDNIDDVREIISHVYKTLEEHTCSK